MCFSTQMVEAPWGRHPSTSSLGEEDITYHYACIRDRCPGSRTTGSETKVGQNSSMRVCGGKHSLGGIAGFLSALALLRS